MDSELISWRQQAGQLADVRLMAELQQLVKVDRSREGHLLVLLAEMDARQLFLAQGYSSLFHYARSVLRMSEAQAYLRIGAARVARAYPVALEMLVEGAMNLSTLKLLAPHLTAENHVALLERARDKSKREVELLVAEVAPQPDVPTCLRKLPAARANTDQAPLLMSVPVDQSSAQATVEVMASRAAVNQDVQENCVAPETVLTAAAAQVAPIFALEAPRASCTVLRPGRYKLEMTANQAFYDQLMQLQHLLRHQVPGGDLAAIVGLAIKELLDRKCKQRFAQLSKPSRGARTQSSEASSRTRAPALENEAHAATASAGSAPQRSEIALSAPARSNPHGRVVAPSAPARATRLGSVLAPKADKIKPRSRYVPRAVVRAVFARDGALCSFVSADGQRCGERGMLELHHVRAFVRGGASTVENLTVVCRSHNFYFATQDFGAVHMRAMRLRAKAT